MNNLNKKEVNKNNNNRNVGQNVNEVNTSHVKHNKDDTKVKTLNVDKNNNTSGKDVEKSSFEVIKNFEDFQLKETLLRGIFGYGFEKPSSVQQRAILPLLKGKDTIAQAHSGTGKTGCFLIGSLEIIDESIPKPQALILAPTRELARQIHSVCKGLSQYLKGFECCECVGGTPGRVDARNLQRGPQVVIGTPGRTLDNLNRNYIQGESLKILVLDEADEMLSRGFRDALYDIFQFLPNNIQVGLFSATMKADTQELAKSFMRDPETILVKKEKITLDGIAQYYINVDREEYKLETLIDLYECVSIPQVIIFVNSKKKAQTLADNMQRKNFTVSVMHSDLTTDERRLTMKEFRTGSSRVLISTDLLARGIDVQNVSIIINYDLPFDSENYIHRIGRSGRFGRKGVAVNFVKNQRDDVATFKHLQEHYNTVIKELPGDVANVFTF